LKRKAWMIAVPVIAVVLVAAGVLGFRGRSKPTAQNVATAAAQHGQIVVTVSDSGTVSGNVQMDVRAEVAGTVSQVNKDNGDAVKKGDVLAVVASQDVLDAARQAQLDLQSAQAKLDDMVNPKSRATQDDMNQARARLALAEATRTSRQHDLDSLSVKAPVNGTIVSMKYQEGDSAGDGQVFATINDLDHLTFVLPVTENGIPNVQVGQTANVVIGPGNESRNGLVTDVDTAGYVSNGTHLYDVTISLDGGFSPDVRPGISGYAILNTVGHGGQYGVEGKGTVQSSQNLDVHFNVSGTISQLNVREGSVVKAGDVLAVLSNDQAVVSARQADLDYQTAQSNLNQLVNPSVTANQSDITAQQVRVAELQMTAAARQRDVDSLTVRAPIDGIVTARNVSVGDKVGANQATALFTVADYSKMQVTINVDELDVGKVKAGQKARVTIDALPGKTYDAEVVRVAAGGTQQQGVATFPVALSMANPGEVKSGMTANVDILIDQKNNALLVPLEAVTKRGGRSFVRVMGADGKMTQVPVTTGLASDTAIEIVSGLKEGDVVVTSTSATGTQNPFAGFRMGGGGEFRPPTGGAGGNRTGGGGGGGGNSGGSR